ncbi:unnamed protein product [Camellia sinensis]
MIQSLIGSDGKIMKLEPFLQFLELPYILDNNTSESREQTTERGLPGTWVLIEEEVGVGSAGGHPNLMELIAKMRNPFIVEYKDSWVEKNTPEEVSAVACDNKPDRLEMAQLYNEQTNQQVLNAGNYKNREKKLANNKLDLTMNPIWFKLKKNLLPLETIYQDINRILSPVQQDSSSIEPQIQKADSHSEMPTEIAGPNLLSTLQGDEHKSGPEATTDSISREQAKSFTKFRERKGLIDEDVVLIWLGMEMKSQGIDENRLRLLRDVSGAGKTTLMDVLAGRKTGGYIEGNISLSGYPKNQETFARVSGYCEQNDIHSPFVTVHESLLYSAWLRLSKDVKTERKQMFVAEVMDLVELNTLKNALVGLPGVNGLSTEQRKRLTITVELVANPSIIFMDEPTSGLDARAAAIVMRTVRNTVDTGRTVVCTIHQPSIDIFEAFDELLLMKR